MQLVECVGTEWRQPGAETRMGGLLSSCGLAHAWRDPKQPKKNPVKFFAPGSLL
jgi:hypothetical protein